MTVFISGGCKNGKSTYAQTLAKELSAGVPLYYVATMIPHDGEDDARIERHRNERAGWGFETLEQGRDLCALLDTSDTRGVYLLDSVTALVANEMFGADGTIDAQAGNRVAADLTRFLKNVGHAVLVSDFLYSDAAIYDEWTECYRRALALCDRTAAALCDRVLEVSCTGVTVHKGEPL